MPEDVLVPDTPEETLKQLQARVRCLESALRITLRELNAQNILNETSFWAISSVIEGESYE